MVSKFVVNANLPYAGLGNMMLVWARAITFAELNSLSMVAPSWQSFHIGPWLRKERCKRYYGSFFSTVDYENKLKFLCYSAFQKTTIHSNPSLNNIDLNSSEFICGNRHVFLFDRMPPWNDYFQDLKNHQPLVKEKLYRDIHPNLLSRILQKPAPKIGIHIRRGDYQSPQVGDDFAVRRYVYTSLDWYIDVLKSIRNLVGYDIPATVFSDGYPEELQEMLVLPNVTISPETSAISDLITMSRSELLIASSHSSFSAWASYLAQCPTVWYSERAKLYEPIFSGEIQKKVFEGGFDPNSGQPLPELLCQNILRIFQ
jgi:Glycosyl transferase family 11